MLQVWLLFKVIESIAGTFCMTYHAIGFSDKEPLPHTMLFCGTFVGFTLLSFIAAIGIIVGNTPTTLIECVINFCAAVLYLMASIVSMIYADRDLHLRFLSDFEEPLHPYFANCRAQSLSALAAGCVHLLHALLSFDILMYSYSNLSDSESEYDSENSHNSEVLPHDKQRPLRLYFLGKTIENKLRKNVWFDHLCQRRVHRMTAPSDVHKSHSSVHGFRQYTVDDLNSKNRLTVAELDEIAEKINQKRRSSNRKGKYVSESDDNIIEYINKEEKLDEIEISDTKTSASDDIPQSFRPTRVTVKAEVSEAHISEAALDIRGTPYLKQQGKTILKKPKTKDPSAANDVEEDQEVIEVSSIALTIEEPSQKSQEASSQEGRAQMSQITLTSVETRHDLIGNISQILPEILGFIEPNSDAGYLTAEQPSDSEATDKKPKPKPKQDSPK